MTASPRKLRPQLALAAAMALGSLVPPLAAAEFTKAQLYLELNDTDGDLGIHALIDGGPYTRLEIEGPHDRTLLALGARGALMRQGLTELFFESAEPNFDDLPPEAFFRRFREGTYEIEAIAMDGTEIEAEVELSHVLAAPPANIAVGGLPAAEGCDGPLPAVAPPVVVDWDEVTTSHPAIGASGPVEVERYEFVLEGEGIKMAVDLPPLVTEFQIPADALVVGSEFKFEIITRTADGNNTAIESCFTVL